MRGRFAGVIFSAILSIASIILFFNPGLNYTIDFVGGVVVELRFPEPVDAGKLRTAFSTLGLGEASVQSLGLASVAGSDRDALVKLTATDAKSETIRQKIQ